MRGVGGLLLVGMLASTPAFGAAVSVSFIEPENYTDAALYGPGAKGRETVLRQLESHLETLGDRLLRPGQTLRIEVLDVDLAGRYPFSPVAYDVRILDQTTWPRIRLRYALEQGGRTLDRAEEAVVSMNYLAEPNRRSTTDRLRYEKAMLDDWFRARFATQRNQGDD